jgi:hypothetical protein
VDLKERTHFKAHNIEIQTEQVQNEHSKLTEDRITFLEEVDRRVQKKLEDWAEIHNIQGMLKRENYGNGTQQDDRSEINIPHASPEKSYYGSQYQYDQNGSPKSHKSHKKNQDTKDLKNESIYSPDVVNQKTL